MNNYELIQYEVWGNEEDGFEVNNLFKIGEYEVLPHYNYQQILSLINAKSNVTIDENLSCGMNYYFIDCDNGKPLGELRLI